MLVRALLVMLSSMSLAMAQKAPPVTYPVKWSLAAGSELKVTFTSGPGKIEMLWVADRAIDTSGTMRIEVQSARVRLGTYGVATQIAYKQGRTPVISVGKGKSPRHVELARKNAEELVRVFTTGTLTAQIGQTTRLKWVSAKGTSTTGGWVGAFFVDAPVHTRLPKKPVAARDTYIGSVFDLRDKDAPRVKVLSVSEKAAKLSYRYQNKNRGGGSSHSSTTEVDRAGGFVMSAKVIDAWAGGGKRGGRKVSWTWRLVKGGALAAAGTGGGKAPAGPTRPKGALEARIQAAKKATGAAKSAARAALLADWPRATIAEKSAALKAHGKDTLVALGLPRAEIEELADW